MTTIRVYRPEGRFGTWEIRARRGNRVVNLAHRGELRELIMTWRYARERGKIDRMLSS